jgi:uncharacterized protein YkwD
MRALLAVVLATVAVATPFKHWYTPASHAAKVCGNPTGSITWHGSAATQPTQRCTLHLKEWYTRNQTPTPVPSTPTPTATPVPPTPIPTNTPPIPTATPTQTPRPIPSPTPQPADCVSGGCQQFVLQIINHHRASVGVAPLQLDMTMSNGTSGCAGSIGHSEAMAASGTIWHVNSQYPQNSFPNGVCAGSYRMLGQNVGVWGGGDVASAVQSIDNLMMQEPHDPATCASQTNHACSIINPAFTRLGVGVYASGGTAWLTTDFAG